MYIHSDSFYHFKKKKGGAIPKKLMEAFNPLTQFKLT